MNRFLYSLGGWTLLTAVAWYATSLATIYLLQVVFTSNDRHAFNISDVSEPIFYQACFFAFLGMIAVPFLWRRKPKGWIGAFEILFAYPIFIYAPLSFLGLILGGIPDMRIDAEIHPVVVNLCYVIGSVSGLWAFFFGAPSIALSASYVALIWKWHWDSPPAEEAHEPPL